MLKNERKAEEQVPGRTLKPETKVILKVDKMKMMLGVTTVKLTSRRNTTMEFETILDFSDCRYTR